MKRVILIVTAALFAAALVLIGLYIYYQNRVQSLGIEDARADAYAGHYLFVSSDTSGMLQDAFSAVSAAAEESGAYLEWCGRGGYDEYSASECVEISLAMGADGIIVYPDGSSDLTEAIRKAADQKIPVVTILRDLPDSNRVSYVGMSCYQAGEVYGRRLISLMRDGENKVCLLQDRGDTKSETQLLYTQMIQTVKEEAPSGKKLEIDTQTADSTTDFDAEEVIRNILLDKDRPDILICMNSVQTECAIQALIDLNLVGDVQVIGFYITETILSALRQDLIPVVMTLDTAALGKDCVQALDDYQELGRASSYYNINLDSVTPLTVDAYLRKKTGSDSYGEAEA